MKLKKLPKGKTPFGVNNVIAYFLLKEKLNGKLIWLT